MSSFATSIKLTQRVAVIGRKSFSGIFGMAALGLTLGCGGGGSNTSYIFELVVRNTANPPIFQTAGGRQAVVVYSPALGVIHTNENPMYQIGQPAANGLETFAEDGDASDLLTSLSTDDSVLLSVLGVQPVEEDSQSGVLLPDTSYRVVFNVEERTAKLSFALQFLQSNDVIVGTNSDGIALFDADGQPLTQDITAQLQYLDAGTEVNQAPGDGDTQPLFQTESNQGTTESNVVRPVDDGFTYPAIAGNLQVTITSVTTVD